MKLQLSYCQNNKQSVTNYILLLGIENIENNSYIDCFRNENFDLCDTVYLNVLMNSRQGWGIGEGEDEVYRETLWVVNIISPMRLPTLKVRGIINLAIFGGEVRYKAIY